MARNMQKTESAQDVFAQEPQADQPAGQEAGAVPESPAPEAVESKQDLQAEQPKRRAAKGKPPPYVGANAVSKTNLDHAKFQNMTQADDSIVTPSGHSQYFCKYNCSNGRYVRGRSYVLRDDAPLVLAKNKEGRGKFFKKI